MSKPFDATLKELIRSHPYDWLAVLDRPPTGAVSVLTADLSTVTASADAVLRVDDELFHIDFQSGPDPGLPRRTLRYNVLLHDQYELPVHSIVLLLRPRADRGDLTGQVAYAPRPERGHLDFGFEVVRLWEMPVERLLAGGPGLLPLAVLGQLPAGVTEEEMLPGVVERIVERLEAEVPSEAPTLVTAAFVLAGLRLTREQVSELFRGVQAMRESTSYQLILEEGEAKGRAEGRADQARRDLLRIGQKRMGPPDAATETAFQAITDVDRLERMADRLLDAASWHDLLQTP